ncbi:MAG: glycosyltransferase family 2 protein [Thermoflexales bacterium]|nr:glycosyltransferase family 2 protein [Thermoflexales bacterium]
MGLDSVVSTTVGQTVAVIIPAHNEERFIGSVVLRARQHGIAVIVVDDGSSDETAEIARLAGAIVVRHERNLGKGIALNTGFDKARELGADAVVVLDGDGQHQPGQIPAIAAPVLAGQADLVVGSRYLERRNGDVPTHRAWGHWVFTRLTNLLSGVSVTDSQSGFRAFSRRALEVMPFYSGGFSVESEMQFLAQENKLKVIEVPITIHYQDKPKRNVLVHGLLVLNGVLRLIGQHRPLLSFGLPGALALLAGLLLGIGVVHIYRTSHELAMGYALLVVTLVLMGSFSLFTGIILHSVRALLLDWKQKD